MNAWKCPTCNGEFPSPVEVNDLQRCPWCGNDLRHEWEPTEDAVVRNVVKDDRGDGPQPTPLRNLLGAMKNE